MKELYKDRILGAVELHYCENSLAIRLKTLGDEHPDVAFSYNNIGSIWKRKGKFDKALEFYEKSLVIRLKVHGDQHPSTCASYNNLGSVWNDKGEYDKAIKLYQQSLDIRLKTLGTEHPDVASTYFNIGSINKNLNNFVLAIENYQKGFSIQQTGGYPFKIAQCYEELHEKEKALDYYFQSAEIRKDNFGLEHDATQESIVNAKRLANELIKESDLPEWMN
jgi:tetratricopeptide (TPR) repeat protein